mmetsp:Transcript_12286/g.22216  ORF Transcript_12286/g.22216 Transcript_12286/m.22216 type:complete len:265 (-) Transcript_12286:678-1472(-)
MGNKPSISIIIPALNEESQICKSVESALTTPKQKTSIVEVIVVDGGSTDGTVKNARKCGARVLYQNTVRGRAAQMNLGASQSHGDVFLFLHADSQLPSDYLSQVHQTLSTSVPNHHILGAFRLSIDSSDPQLQLNPIQIQLLKLIQFGSNCRTRFSKMAYGDQALFLHRTTFRLLNGFPEIPLLEDVRLVRNARRHGVEISLANSFVTTSARRWNTLGIIQTTILNQVIILADLLRIPPNTLRNWYRGAYKRALIKREKHRFKN